VAEVDTEKLKAMEAAAKAADDHPHGEVDVVDDKGSLSNLNPSQKALLMLIMGVVGTLVGGAGGQSLFGISDDKLERRFQEQEKIFKEKIDGSAGNLENKMEIIRLQNDTSAKSIANNTDEIRQLNKTVRDLESRVVKIEARGGD